MKVTISLIAPFLSLFSTTTAQTTEFYLRSISTHAAYNGIPFGGVGTVNGILVGGLQPLQTLPVGGTMTSGILSFLEMDPSDPGPAYFIHGTAGSWIQLDVFGVPQSGYSLSSSNILTISGGGKFYACSQTAGTNTTPVIGVFYNSNTGAVPSGCYTIQLEAVFCTNAPSGCA
ncbi:hypothetical protein B0O99DRAFT_103370 [Bisporella sp. PMI_857]|nr:hypothetical protein B0O99DRAFT_103370 [Bisporella sp. PMI_857]